MSAPTQASPAATEEQSFDEAMMAYLGASQHPTDAGATGATPQDTEPTPATAGTATAPREADAASSPSATGEPAATEGTTEAAPVDWEARYRELEAKATSEAARELSAAGRLKKANEELAQLRAEAERERKAREAAEARQARQWEEAIANAPEVRGEADDPRFVFTKAELRAARDRELQSDELAAREQQVAQHEAARQSEREQQRAAAEQMARQYATEELDYAIGVRAQQEGLPSELFQPVRDFINSPVMQKLAEVLPLTSQHALDGDPLTWDVRRISNLDQLRTYLVANAEAGYAYYKQQHAEAQVKAEEERIEQNARAAQQTYRPEAAVGAGGARSAESADQHAERVLTENIDVFAQSFGLHR